MFQRGLAAAASLTVVACASGAPAPVEFRETGARQAPARAERSDHRGEALATSLGNAVQANQEFDPAHSPDTLVIERGMTLVSIAERYRIPVEALVQANNLKAPYALELGRILTIPAPKLYIVQPGETFMSVALKFSIDPRSLALYNRWEKPWVLDPGDEVMLPPLVGDAVAAARVRTQTPVPEGRTSSTDPGRQPGSTRAGRSVAASQTGSSVPASARASASGVFGWPVKGDVIARFGPQPGGLRSDGVAIAAPEGAPITAAAPGVVVYAGDEIAGYGNLVLIRHEGGYITAYAHARTLKVREGQKVDRSTVIGEVGQTGSAERPQLHFEIRQNARAIDPITELPAA
jgi:murein DD-endopeptidase MepM/ murein hydrolase activator NlpD